MGPQRDEPRFVSDEARELVRGLETVSNDLAALATFMRGAETLRAEGPDAATEARHLAAIAQETARVRASVPAASEQRPSVLGVLRSRWFKGTAIGLAAVLTTGGLAAARVLPAPAQNAIAAVAEAIGLDLPRADGTNDTVQSTSDFDGDGIPNGEDPVPGQPVSENDPLGDVDGDGIPNGEDPESAQVKDGLDHDGDGVPDDNGNHTGQLAPKDGLDHDGDGVPDDNGNHAQPSTPPGRENTPKPQKTEKPEKTEKPDAPPGRQLGEDTPENGSNGNGQDPEEDPGKPDVTARPEKTPKP